MKQKFYPVGNRGFSFGAFTLIELLVVIAIIGLLISIVLVSLIGQREKARIAKGLQFSQSLHHALGAYSVGVWRFDEGSDATAFDSSGYGNHGTLKPSYLTNAPTWTTGILGNALSFDGNDYINVPDSNSLDISGSLSISVWVKHNAISQKAIVGKWTDYSSNKSYLVMIGGGNNIRFLISSNGSYNGSWDWGSSGNSVPVNVWKNVVVIYNGTGIEIWIDGVLNTSDITDIPASVYVGTAPVRIGNYDSGYYFNGLIDEVRIYSEALSTAEIQKLYVEGLEKYKNLTIE